jgi:hypothetical protein
MTDETADQLSSGDASAVGATPAPPDDGAKPPAANKIEPPATRTRFRQWGPVVNQWGAVFAACIAALAAITGTVVGVYNAYSQTHLSAVQAERQEKRDNYAKFLTDVEALNAAAWDVHELFRTHPELMSARANDEKGAFNTAWDEYTNQDDIVSIIDSDSPAVDAARDKISNHMDTLKDIVYVFTDAPASGTLNTLPGRQSEFDTDAEAGYQLMFAFRDASKADLKKLGYGDN